jgi:hypothetical protein
LKAPEYRGRRSWVDDSFDLDVEEPRSALAEYSPIVFGGLMLVAAFAFAGHYIGRNASAHTADAAIASIACHAVHCRRPRSFPARVRCCRKSETFPSVALDQLRRQTVQVDGKGDLFCRMLEKHRTVSEDGLPLKKKAVAGSRQGQAHPH